MAPTRGFVDATRQVNTNGGNRRMDAPTRSTLGTYYKAQEIIMAICDENGQQITNTTEASKVLSSWYAGKAKDTEEFERTLRANTAQVVQELATMEPKPWTKRDGMTRQDMLDALGNKMARIALTTAAIIPTSFKLGEKQYSIRTQTASYKGPNPLIPSNDCKTCLYENASNNVPVNSYWPEEVHKRIMKNFRQAAGINLVDVDDNGQIVAPGTGLPGVTSNGRLIFYFRKPMEYQNIDNSKTVNFFEEVELIQPAPKRVTAPTQQGVSTPKV